MSLPEEPTTEELVLNIDCVCCGLEDCWFSLFSSFSLMSALWSMSTDSKDGYSNTSVLSLKEMFSWNRKSCYRFDFNSESDNLFVINRILWFQHSPTFIWRDYFGGTSSSRFQHQMAILLRSQLAVSKYFTTQLIQNNEPPSLWLLTKTDWEMECRGVWCLVRW